MRKTLELAPIGLEAWPAQDAANWHAALVTGGIFDDGGALAGRAEREVTRFRSRYGVWLAFLMQDRHDRVIESGLDYLGETDLLPATA